MRPGPGTCNRGGVRHAPEPRRKPFMGARYWLPASIVLWAVILPTVAQQLATHWPQGWTL